MLLADIFAQRILARVLLAFLTSIPTLAIAASFDCSKARSPVEALICSDAELSKLDDDLSQAYRARSAQSNNVAALRKEQQAWLTQRNACQNAQCVKASYEARLKALSENSNGTPQTGSGSDALQPNCDPAKGGVDIDSCPEFRREGLKATYCMDGGISCSSYLADQARKKTRLLKGDPKLCRELLTATFEYVAFDLPHSLSPKELTEFGDRWVELGTYAGRADFNNDGKDEVLLPVTLKARNSRSCDQQVFVEVNARLEAFPQTPFDQLFRADVECSENFYPFLYKGKTFFETRRRSTTCCWFGFDLLNEVYLVTAHTRSRVCQFKYDDN